MRLAAGATLNLYRYNLRSNKPLFKSRLKLFSSSYTYGQASGPAGVSLSLQVIQNPGRALDIAQIAISVVGIAPGVGEIADLANAGISGARGNYTDAALDLAGAAGPVGSVAAVGNRIRRLTKAKNLVEAGADVSAGISKGRKQVFYDFSTR